MKNYKTIEELEKKVNSILTLAKLRRKMRELETNFYIEIAEHKLKETPNKIDPFSEDDWNV
jgi:hypothetical protein